MVKMNSKQVQKATEKKVYFSTTYAFNKVTNLKVGDRKYAIFLNPEDNLYCTMVHEVKKRKGGKGFKDSKYGSTIKCKSYDLEGNKLEELAECCTLQTEEYEKLPGKENSDKRLLSYSKPMFHAPVMVLGSNITDKEKQAYPVGNVRISSGCEPAFIKFQKTTWMKEIIGEGTEGGLAKKLKDDGIIDFDLEGEELTEAVYSNLGSVIIEINAVGKILDGKEVPVKEYSFIPFTDIKIAKASGEYDLLVNWKTSDKMVDFRNEVAEFLALLESHENEFSQDWEEGDVKKYMVDGGKKAEDEEAFREADSVPETQLRKPTKAVTQSTEVPSSPIEQVSEVDFSMDDYEYSDEEEEFID